MPDRRRRVAVLISGRGSNLQALLSATAGAGSSAEIVLVVSDRAEAPGLAHAAAAGVPTAVVDRAAHPDRASFESFLEVRLQASEPEIICLAGFMRILSARFVAGWAERILNVHPSLLPAFPGLDTHRRALDAGVRLHGCTVHVVRAAVDAGPILIQGVVPVLADDDEETLAARVLAVEHRCYPYALELMAAGRVRIEGERALIDGSDASGSLINPVPAA
jgi:phosphoribosylglycinamide formyltransferase-1